MSLCLVDGLTLEQFVQGLLMIPEPMRTKVKLLPEHLFLHAAANSFKYGGLSVYCDHCVEIMAALKKY